MGQRGATGYKVELDRRRSHPGTVPKNITTGIMSFDRYGLIETINKAVADLPEVSAAV
jgi:hypothetical protein